MDFYTRYRKGEFKTVYDEILELKQDAFSPENFSEIEMVLEETFRRVSYNLKIIYQELKKIDYLFKTNFESNFDKPLCPPLPNTENLLKNLEKNVSSFGYVPLSLRKFYQIVGSCNFVWNYEINEERFWEGADPIQVGSLDELTDYTASEDWIEDMNESVEDSEKPYLELSADFLHKDNISGGMPYSIEITDQPSIDGLFLFEPHNTTFVDYLRISLENCGFSLISEREINNDHKSFFSRVKPQLLKI